MELQQPGVDILTKEDVLIRASSGQRFLNYLIDVIVFYGIFFLIGIIIAITSPSTIDSINDSAPGFSLLDRLLTLVAYAVYMGLVEGVFKGKSLGKLITSTKAVNLDGSNITFGTAFARGFSRAVPFCALSAFGTPCNPWQDKWTNTMVIDQKQSQLS